MTHDRFNAVVASISYMLTFLKAKRAGWNPRLTHVGKECERIYFLRLTLDLLVECGALAQTSMLSWGVA